MKEFRTHHLGFHDISSVNYHFICRLKIHIRDKNLEVVPCCLLLDRNGAKIYQIQSVMCGSVTLVMSLRTGICILVSGQAGLRFILFLLQHKNRGVTESCSSDVLPVHCVSWIGRLCSITKLSYSYGKPRFTAASVK